MFLGYVYNMFFLEKLWNPQEWENILEPGKKATSMREASKIQFAGELTSLRCGKPEASTVMGMAQAIVYLFWPAKSVIFSNEPQYLIWGQFFSSIHSHTQICRMCNNVQSNVRGSLTFGPPFWKPFFKEESPVPSYGQTHYHFLPQHIDTGIS
jgi:hypothetical protein